MGIKITLKNDDLVVETDYGAGDIDHSNVQRRQVLVKRYMKDLGVNEIEAEDYHKLKWSMTEKLKKRYEKGPHVVPFDLGL